MLFFSRFNPASVDPELFVDRDDEHRWLHDGLAAYLDKTTPPRGEAFCLWGDKGIGKSILARRVLHDLRRDYSGRTLFLEVDCNHKESWRRVLAAIARATVAELGSLARAGQEVSQELRHTAMAYQELSYFDDVTKRQAHEHVRQFQAALRLSGKRSMLALLQNAFDIVLERSKTVSDELAGSIRLDEAWMTQALAGLFSDIREQGLDIVLLLDNLDELNPRYWEEAQLDRVRRAVEGLLSLQDAPIALLLTMRTYYTRVLTREVVNRYALGPLGPSVLQDILDVRLRDERDEVREAVGREDVRHATEVLVHRAPTPLAFLCWYRQLFPTERLTPDGLGEGFRTYIEQFYSNLPYGRVRTVIEAFDPPSRPLDRAALLAVCGGDERFLGQLLDRGVVLPVDFWNATEFTLDPELHHLADFLPDEE